MAEVYRAKQLGHGGFEKIVAVKRILPQYAESDDFKEMFLQEASLSAHLQHPNIVQTYSNGEVSGYLFLTMEYVDGKNLRQILAKVDRQKKRIPIEYSLYVIAEAAKGLHYAHDFVDERSGQGMNIVHRDMSPQNVMLGYDGTVKIVDFGIAKMAAQAESTRAGVLKGKFGYMSPEQARGMNLDRRTDVFALGIILFELLTQRRLFASDDDMRTLRLVKECRIPRPSKYNPSIGPKLDHIVLKALAKEKSERYASAYEFYEDLQRLVQESYPKFIGGGDFSKFMRGTFVEEIREEKLKREKLHREAPALLDDSRHEDVPESEEAPAPRAKRAAPEAGGATVVDDEQPTQISNAMDSVEGLDVPELGDASAKTGLSHSAAFSDPEPPRLTELQLESPKIDGPRTQLQPIGSRDLPPSSDFASSSNTHIAPVYIENNPTRTYMRPPKRKRNPAKLRRLSYVALILIGVISYLAQEETPSAPPAQVAETPSVEKGSETIVEAAKPVEATPEITRSNASENAPSAAEVAEAPTPAPVAPAPLPESVVVAPSVVEPELVVPQISREPSIKVQDNRDTRVAVESPAASDSAAPAAQGHLPGYLSITSYPRADRIMIDGQMRRGPASEPLTGPISRLELPPGRYEIVLQNSTYGVSWHGTVIIRSQRISSLEDVVLK